MSASKQDFRMFDVYLGVLRSPLLFRQEGNPGGGRGGGPAAGAVPKGQIVIEGHTDNDPVTKPVTDERQYCARVRRQLHSLSRACA